MWWRDEVVYQIYPRSFADSDGDGVGDLNGIRSKLDHLAWLGIDAIWLSPHYPSPNEDWGYDVSDYCDVHPELGTLDDFDALVADARECGIRVVCDLVPNHTSDQHPWFGDASMRDRYVWADPTDGSPPNNWQSNFGGPAWTLDESSGQFYLHHFVPEQPDLNWWNPDVQREFDDILAFWFDRGVAGFRIDVCHMVFKDRELRDNPPATEDDHPRDRARGQRLVYNSNLPEVHELLRHWRKLADARDPQRLLLGETFVTDLDVLLGFYGTGDELHLAFNFRFALGAFEADRLATVVERMEARLRDDCWQVWTGSNHDIGRLATRWCDGDEGKVRCALLMLLTLRGTPVLYTGDEIGLPDGTITRDDLRDPVGLRYWPDLPGRDPCRTPMHWEPGPGAGFTTAGTKPWLPIGDNTAYNVTDQRADPSSTLHFCRDLIAVRRGEADLRRAPYERLDAPEGVWMWRRGASIVALNLSDEEREAAVAGDVVLSTTRDREGDRVDGSVRLRPWEGLLLRR